MDVSSAMSALVTGGGSGLGAATARHLAGRGVHVVLADLPSSPTADLASELTASGAPVHAIDADVREVDQLHAAAARAQELAPLRIVVCCAGIATPGRIISRRGPLDTATASNVVAINLLGTINTIAATAPLIAESDPLSDDGERGVIVLTSSVAGTDGQVGQLAYAASKAGVAGMTLPAARDLAQHAIRVVTIAPGVFDTSMMQGLGPDVRDGLAALIPYPPRLGHASEYAELAAHIIANPMINGEVIRLDGALRMPPR